MRLRIVTALAIAVVAFYAGVAVDAARTPAEIEIPDSILPVTTVGGEPRIRESWVAVGVQSHSNRLETVAAIAAVVAAAFLLARLVVVVATQVRLRRAA